MRLEKIIVTLFCFLQMLQLFGQEAKLQELYSSREFEKCFKKSTAIVGKNTEEVYAYYYLAITLFEMEQLPSKYKEITDRPIEDCLKAIAKLSKYDDGSYAEEHADTLKMIREYAETMANDLVGSNKIRAIKLYKLLARAYVGEYSKMQIIEIYFKSDDFDAGFRSVERMFQTAPAGVSLASDKQLMDDLAEGLRLLIKYSMFNNAYYIMEQYQRKFEGNKEVGKLFSDAVFYALERLAPAADKNLFFSYTDRSLQLFADSPEFKKYLYAMFVDLLEKKENEFASIEKPSSWRDSVSLRDFYQYSIICYSIFPQAELKDREEAVTAKYRMRPEVQPGSLFYKVANDVLHEMRYNECACNTGLFPGQDTLTFSLDLALMAQEHARDMFAFNYTDTTSRDGKAPLDRVHDTGLKPFKYNTFEGVVFYGAVEATECVSYSGPIGAAKTEDEYRVAIERVFERWRSNKQGDCEKIMTPQYTHYGFAAFGDRYSLVLAKVLDLRD